MFGGSKPGGRLVSTEIDERQRIDAAITECQDRITEFNLKTQLAEQDLDALFKEFKVKNKTRCPTHQAAVNAFRKTPDYIRLDMQRRRGNNAVKQETARLEFLLNLENVTMTARNADMTIQDANEATKLLRPVIGERKAEQLHEALDNFNQLAQEVTFLQTKLAEAQGVSDTSIDTFEFGDDPDPSLSLEEAPSPPKGFVATPKQPTTTQRQEKLAEDAL